MILIIPVIEIRDGKCTCVIQSLPENPRVYPDDPIEVAKIWRKENARALYLIDVDGKIAGKPQNLDVFRKIVNAIDIPVIASGGFRDYESVKQAIKDGILRIALDTAVYKDFELLKKLINEFMPKRITIHIEARNENIIGEDVNALEIVQKVKEVGIERIIYNDTLEDGSVNFKALENIVGKAEIKITVEGELNGYQDLKKLFEFERYGVDSVIINKALYHNKFPCQHLWRIVEAELNL
ncbi:MAG: HisA/HisF-related TIM barrel protein [Candidatus Kryptonium sp.]